MEFDLERILGSQSDFSTQRLTLYVPNKDRNSRKLKDHEHWVKEARALLTAIGGGATAYPPADGTWASETGKIIWEQTRIIYCFIVPERFQEKATDLREFLHRFGRETNQGEVVVEFDGRFYRVVDFEPAGGRHAAKGQRQRKRGRAN